MFGTEKKRKAKLLAAYFKIKTEAFDFSKIERYFLHSDKTEVKQVISDKTCQDLDLNEIFRFIDRTVSKVGQQYLYHTLRTIPGDKNRQTRLEHLLNLLSDSPELRDSVVCEISRLNSKEAYYITSLFSEDFIQKPKWFWMIKLLSCTSIGFILFSFVFPQLLIALIFILGINYIIHYWNKNNLYQYGSSIPQLLILNQIAKKILQYKIPAEEPDHLTACIKTIDGVGNRMSVFKLEAKLQSDIGLLVEHVVEIIKALFLIEPILLFSVLEELNSKRKEIHTVYKFIGEVDTAISVSSLRDSLPYYCHPLITEEKKHISAQDVYHPFITNCVPNSIELNQRSVLLTGSNMSGKTTFIRTIGINAVVAQTINTCFARVFEIPRLSIHSAIRTTDDLMNDKSYYFEEVLSVKNLVDVSKTDSYNLFLLDELFKGTNTVERIAAGKSVLNYLNNAHTIIFISTHDLELTEFLKDTFNLYHFTETVENKTISFDYKIKTGNLKTTNAIRILELNNYPPEIILEAKAISRQLNEMKAGSATL